MEWAREMAQQDAGLVVKQMFQLQMSSTHKNTGSGCVCVFNPNVLEQRQVDPESFLTITLTQMANLWWTDRRHLLYSLGLCLCKHKYIYLYITTHEHTHTYTDICGIISSITISKLAGTIFTISLFSYNLMQLFSNFNLYHIRIPQRY